MTIKDLARDSAVQLACWKADVLLPDSWSARDYGSGYTRASVAAHLQVVRKLLPMMSRKFKLEVGQLIRDVLAKRLNERRAISIRRAA